MTELLPLALIDPDPDQPRKIFPAALLNELADSITESGLLQPITVRPVEGGRYLVVAGERRYRAHKILAETGRLAPAVIEAHVRDMDPIEIKVTQIVENAQRADVTPLEESDAFAALVAAGMEPEEIARRCGLAPFRVKWRLTLQNLAPDIRQLFATDNLDRQQALELARLPSHVEQHRLLKLIGTGRLVGWKAVRNAVDALVSGDDQSDFFGGKPSEKEIEVMRAMERRIEAVVKLTCAGFHEGECVIAAKVNPDNVAIMADKLSAIQKSLRIMERALRNVGAQAAMCMVAA